MDTRPHAAAAMSVPRSTGPLAAARRHPVGAYVAVTFAVSWAFALPLALDAAPSALHLAVALGPTVGAVVATAAVTGRVGLRELGQRIVDVRRVPSWRWWAVGVSPLAAGAVALALVATTGRWPDEVSFDGEGWLVGLVGASVAFGVFEEIGWRGFLLPHLQSSRTASRASLVLWAVWAAWHAPMFAYHFDADPLGVFGWLVGLYFGTVLLTVLVNSCGGCIATAIAFHSCLDLASIATAATASWAPALVTASVIATTIALARWGGPTDLSRYGRSTVTEPPPDAAGPRPTTTGARPWT